MNIARTVLLAMIPGLFPATPAFAAGAQPCNAEPLDGYYEFAAVLHDGPGYFPEQQAGPDADAEADPGDEAESPDADSDEGQEFAPDAQGCADITLAPYDLVLRPLTEDAHAQAVDLRRARVPAWKDQLV